MLCNQLKKDGKRCRSKAGLCRWHPQSGGNALTDAIRARITALKEGPKNGPSSRFQSLLDQGGKIVKLELARKPVHRPITAAANIISLGGFGRKQKELDYDDVYHNFLLVTLDNGKTYKVEKNETVQERPASKDDLRQERFEIPLKGKDLTLKEMVANASKDRGEGFWRYRADRNNCQRFTREMIESSGLLPEDAGPEHEVQDADALLTAAGPIISAKNIANRVTDAAATFDRVLHGDGLRRLVHKML